MPSYGTTAMLTVGVVVAGSEVTRLANIKWNAERTDKQKALRITRPVTTVMTPVLAGFTLGLFLFAAGMINERIATLICALIVVASLVQNGANLFAILPATLTK